MVHDFGKELRHIQKVGSDCYIGNRKPGTRNQDPVLFLQQGFQLGDALVVDLPQTRIIDFSIGRFQKANGIQRSIGPRNPRNDAGFLGVREISVGGIVLHQVNQNGARFKDNCWILGVAICKARDLSKRVRILAQIACSHLVQTQFITRPVHHGRSGTWMAINSQSFSFLLLNIVGSHCQSSPARRRNALGEHSRRRSKAQRRS
mmetsp:Transcript_35684/g.74252  ORF Transcript_35684/g.74252 Transcript_35684/m.74252 type:complete len:204 (-) Transcript_35684:144-755(-)